MSKPVLVRGRPLGRSGAPLVCVPLIGTTMDAVLVEARAMAALVPAGGAEAGGTDAPDLLEWRVDALDVVADGGALASAAGALRAAAASLPLLVTLRAAREGGRDHGLDDAARAARLVALIGSGVADAVDFEMDSDPVALDLLRSACRRHGVLLVLSAHHFDRTPPIDEMIRAFGCAAGLGADIGKLAVMPKDARDTEALLTATAAADRELDIPLVSMAMGDIGVGSRIIGFRHGSRITWASAGGASAPGQLPLAELRRRLRGELAG